MKKIYVKIQGIHCDNCINKITNELLKINNIKKVKIKNNIAEINYIDNINNNEIINKINNIGFVTKEEYISSNYNKISNKIKLKEFLMILIFLIIIYFLIYKIFGYNIFNRIPNIDENITYGMIFIIGLFTSLHCISMCGALNLLLVVNNKKRPIKNSILYNIGRIISYCLIGAVVGLIRKVLSFNKTIQGIIILISSIIILLMSLRMIGIINFTIKLPKIFKNKKSNNAFLVGLLNGFMPCGPLQSMELYALSTGSIIKGALAMLIFGIGTLPLMLTFSFIYNLLKGNLKIIITKISSVLIFLLSLIMLNRALSCFGINITNNSNNYLKSIDNKDEQVVKFDLSYDNYKDIEVKKNKKVKMIIHVNKKYLTDCNKIVESKDFKFNKKLKVGDNIIIFTPKKEGIYTYNCYMNMIKNRIKVTN